jgi:anti-sigma factor (TIGR02949 family)
MSGHGPGSPECRELFARLSEYLDGELSEATCAGVEDHLGDCPPCQVFLESLRRTVRLIETTKTVPMPEEVRRSVRNALRNLREDRG